MNSDRSVAIAAGLTLNPGKSRFYESFDNLRFNHLQNLRNDASCRAHELGITEGKEVAFDYHCDQSDSRFPRDKSLSKSATAHARPFPLAISPESMFKNILLPLF
jgi:hypothetical protein